MDLLLKARSTAFLVVALGAVVLLPGTATLPLIDRDEPRFAEATRVMMAGGDWIVPHFNGQLRLDKPPLTYWLMSLGYRIAGVGEFGARLHSIVTSLLVALCLAVAGRRWLGGRAGLKAAVFWLLSLQVLVHSRLAVADMPMVLAVTVACLLIAESVERELTLKEAAGLWLALGLGFLAKGPIALAVPALALLLFRVLLWRRPLSGGFRPLLGVALLLLVVAPWGIAALIETQGEFWRMGIGYNVIDRGTDAFNGRTPVPLYYLLSSLLSLFPWIAFSGYAVVAARRQWDARRAFLVAWLIAPYLIFSFYATQLPHYVLPGFPAAMLLFADASERMPRLSGAGRLFASGFRGLVLALVGLIVGVLAVAGGRLEFPGLRLAFFGFAALLAGLALGALLFYRFRIELALAAALIVGLGMALLGQGLRDVSPAVQSAETWLADLPPDAVCAWDGFEEPSLVFYTRRTWRPLADWPAGTAPDCAVTAHGEIGLEALLRGDGTVSGGEEPVRPSWGPGHRVAGFNPARSKWVEIDVWRTELTPSHRRHAVPGRTPDHRAPRLP